MIINLECLKTHTEVLWIYFQRRHLADFCRSDKSFKKS